MHQRRFFLSFFMICAFFWPSFEVHAQPFQGDGKEYVMYLNQTLWVWAKEDNTTVTVRRLSNNAVLGTLTLAKAGDMARQNYPDTHVRVQGDKPIFVASGVIGTGTSNNDAYATYLLSENGSRIGKSFEGYTRSEVLVACQRDASSTTPPSVQLIDVSDQGTANDDSVTLGLAQATLSNTDVIYWYRNNFDDDQIRVKANLPCAVLVGHRFRTNPVDDFSFLPPSFDPRDEGRSVGHRFFTYAHAPLTIIATENNTTITIRDLSDGDDTRTITLNRKQFFTTRPTQAVYNGYTQVNPTPANLFDDDFVDINANKPIVVYVGPTTSDVNEHSIFAESVPRGNGKQEAYCFIQNGGASDFQIFALNNQTRVTVSTMGGGSGDSSILQSIGPGGSAWSGPATGPVWWQSAGFRFELVHIEADGPIVALCGDFDKASWQSFLPFYAPNRAPQIAANSALTRTIQEGQNLNITFTGSDPDGDTTLTWSVTALPTGATFTGAGLTRTFNWTPNFTQSGTYQVQISLRDSGVPARTTTITLTIIVLDVNRPPVITSTATTTATEDQAYTYQVQANDPDTGDTLTYKLTQAPPGATIDATGNISWTPGDAEGGRTIDFEVEVCDNKTPPACTKQSWKVNVANVNDPPTITSTPPTNATEDTAYGYNPTATDPDPNTTLTWRFAKDATGADKAPPGATIDPQTGKVSWTPGDADANKEVDFEIEVCDNATPPACTKQSWKTKVANVNDAPVITSTPPTNGRQGDAYNYKPTATDADPNDKLSWKLKSGPAGVSVDPNTGEVKWTPSANDAQAGSREIEIEVCDDATPPACTTQKWTVRVARANQAPQITSTAPTKAYTGQDLGYSPTATDPEGDTLTWRFAKDATGANKAPPGATIDPQTGKVSWTPGPNDAGKDFDFEIEVCDNGTPSQCTTQSFKVRAEQTCSVDASCGPDLICVWDGQQRICLPPGCANKTTTCTASQFCADGKCIPNGCQGQTCAADQTCRPPQGTCIKSCAGVQCPQDQTCEDGTCKPSPCTNACPSGQICSLAQPNQPTCTADPCNATACRHGRLCVAGRCIDDPCSAMQCPANTRCAAGQCLDLLPCQIDADCPTSEICSGKKCRPAGCSNQSTTCNADQFCRDGQCAEDTCKKGTLVCTSPQYCRPGETACASPCANVSCQKGERCRDGKCEKDPCDGVNCNASEVCVEGTCTKERCNETNPCKHGRVCRKDQQTCQEDPCRGVTCPDPKQICANGQCVQPPQCTFDADCAGTALCVNGKCVPSTCSNLAPCPAGSLCRNGKCEPDLCTNKQCPQNQFCSNGACVQSCAGIFCPQGQICRDGQCKADPCGGITCPNGEICVNGSCKTNPCKTDSCKDGRLCREDGCVDDPCKNITCPNAQACKEGQCSGDFPCTYDSDCAGDAVCLAKICKPVGCYKDGCPQGQRCLEGSCKADPCAGITCPDNGSICRPADGKCVRICKDSCPRGQFCIEGECKENPCALVDCQQGFRCELGKCLPEGCFQSPNQKCKSQRACIDGACGDDLCKDFACPNGQTCVQGQCQPPTASTESTNEPSTETTSEPNAETTQQEKTSEDGGGEAPIESQEPNTADKGQAQDNTNTDTNAGIAGGGCGCQQTTPWSSFSILLFLFALFTFRRRAR